MKLEQRLDKDAKYEFSLPFPLSLSKLLENHQPAVIKAKGGYFEESTI